MLFSLPQELLIEVVECCDHPSQRNLSLVSRRLRVLAQAVLFREVAFPKNSNSWISPGPPIHDPERLPGILANKRLLSYVRSLTISMRDSPNIGKIEDVEFLFSMLDRFPCLKGLYLDFLNLSPPMLSHLCALTIERPLDVTLYLCTSPGDYNVPVPTLAITGIKHFTDKTYSFRLFDQLVKASAHAICWMGMSHATPALLAIGVMPKLTKLQMATWDLCAQDFKTFLYATPGLQELVLLRETKEVCALPRAVVPQLRRVLVPPPWVVQLVPGRPITDVEFTQFPVPKVESVIAGLRALPQSTAAVTSLCFSLQYGEASIVAQVMKVALDSVPHLHHFTTSDVAMDVSHISLVLYNLTSPLISGTLRDVGPSHSVSLIARGQCMGQGSCS